MYLVRPTSPQSRIKVCKSVLHLPLRAISVDRVIIIFTALSLGTVRGEKLKDVASDL